MAHFRAYVRGNRGEASRLGSSHMLAVLQSWTWNIEVEARRPANGGDFATVTLKHRGTGESKKIGTFNLSTGEQVS